MIDVDDLKYSFKAERIEFLRQYGETEKSSDLRAVMSTVYRYKKLDDDMIRQMISYAGSINEETTEKFLKLYKSTMEDLLELFSKDEEMLKLIED